MRAPVGQACTHSRQATQVLSPMGSSKSNTILAPWPRAAMPMTSFTCTSRQARTQRLHAMQASRLTAMAVWLRSAATRACAGNWLAPIPIISVQAQKVEHHLARGLGALGGGLHLHARRRRADAARGQGALALDLDHAGAAIAVG